MKDIIFVILKKTFIILMSILFIVTSGCVKNIDPEKLSAIREKGFPIYIFSVDSDLPNSVGGIDVRIDWFNSSPSKTIKYASWTVVPYNAVGDIVTGSVRNLSEMGLTETGPYPPENSESSQWSAVWYNNTIVCVELVKAEIEYMDGSKDTFETEEIKKFSDDWNDCKNPSSN